jgi:hypothetical protein
MFPGILILYLALRREWRAVAWTSAWSVVFLLATLADVGWAPFPYFLHHLPRLLSGEAFPMLRLTPGTVNNLSIPSLVLKVPAFGGPAVPFGWIRITGWIYSVVVLWVVFRLARRPVAPAYEPLAWLAILGLTALRSPFLPTYGGFPGAWLGALLLALCWSDARRWWTVLALWVILVPTTVGPTPIAAWAVAHLHDAADGGRGGTGGHRDPRRPRGASELEGRGAGTARDRAPWRRSVSGGDGAQGQ